MPTIIIKFVRWPETLGTGMAPWFVIAWRAIWMPIIYAGLAIAWIGVLFANGHNHACYFWRTIK